MRARWPTSSGIAVPVGLIVQECLHATAAAAVQELSEPPTLCGLLRESANPLPAGWQEARDWLEHPQQLPPHDPVPEEDPIQIMYTSGTESRPKGAVLSSRNLLAQYASCIIDGEMSGTDIELHALPLYHCAQLHAFLCPGLYLGATNILLPGADPACMLERIEAERVTKLLLSADGVDRAAAPRRFRAPRPVLPEEGLLRCLGDADADRT